MIAIGTMPALLPVHIGVSQTSQFIIQLGLCRHPGWPADRLRRRTAQFAVSRPPDARSYDCGFSCAARAVRQPTSGDVMTIPAVGSPAGTVMS